MWFSNSSLDVACTCTGAPGAWWGNAPFLQCRAGKMEMTFPVPHWSSASGWDWDPASKVSRNRPWWETGLPPATPWASCEIDLGQTESRAGCRHPLPAPFLPELVEILCQQPSGGFLFGSLLPGQRQSGSSAWVRLPEVSPSQPSWELCPPRIVLSD